MRQTEDGEERLKKRLEEFPPRCRIKRLLGERGERWKMYQGWRDAQGSVVFVGTCSLVVNVFFLRSLQCCRCLSD